jgi:murein DD-endopeptidase MepM/ murein hydrolase activator NlpD
MRRGAVLLGVLLLAACSEAPTVPQLDPLPGARLTSAFGPRDRDPVSGETLVDGHHDGYDLAAPLGTPIHASRDGRATFVGVRGGYGNLVILTHPGGWTTLYGHASRFAVRLGQAVRAGQVIAFVGATGHATGPHLHYELRYHDKPVDPALVRDRTTPLAAARTVSRASMKPRHGVKRRGFRGKHGRRGKGRHA